MLTIIAAFIGGAASSRVFTAQIVEAQKATPKQNVVIVPADGLIFKTLAGKTIARMASDSAGGRFGIYNNAGEAVVVIGCSP